MQNEENSTNENDNTDILKNETSNISTENQTNSSNSYNLENISKINADVKCIKRQRTGTAMQYSCPDWFRVPQPQLRS